MAGIDKKGLMDANRAQKYVDSLPVLGEGETFCFECSPDVACFNRCCRQLTLPLTPYDVLRLRRRLGMKSEDFLRTLTIMKTFPDSGLPISMLRMLGGPEEYCPFVTPAGCQVYDDRPGACRSYPLGRGTSPSRHGVAETHYIVHEAHCHGFDKGRDWTAEEWFNHEGLALYNQANDRYMRLVAMVTATGRPLEAKLSSMCILCCYQLDKFREFINKMHIFSHVEISQARQKAVLNEDEAALEFGLDWMELVIFGQSTGLGKKDKYSKD